MSKVGLVAVTVVALSGCLGTASELPEDGAHYDFDTTISVLTAQPQAGRQLSFNLEISSHSDTLVTVDILLRVLNPDDKIIHTETWSAVVFHPEEIWNLTQGFITASDDRGPLRIEVLVLDHETGEELWRERELTLVEML